MRKIYEFSVEEQDLIASQVLSMLIVEIHKDETTAPTGYTISKKRVGELAQKVTDKIRRGALQPSKIIGSI